MLKAKITSEEAWGQVAFFNCQTIICKQQRRTALVIINSKIKRFSMSTYAIICNWHRYYAWITTVFTTFQQQKHRGIQNIFWLKMADYVVCNLTRQIYLTVYITFLTAQLTNLLLLLFYSAQNHTSKVSCAIFFRFPSNAEVKELCMCMWQSLLGLSHTLFKPGLH